MGEGQAKVCNSNENFLQTSPCFPAFALFGRTGVGRTAQRLSAKIMLLPDRSSCE
jgi:hypothetical protein